MKFVSLYVHKCAINRFVLDTDVVFHHLFTYFVLRQLYICSLILEVHSCNQMCNHWCSYLFTTSPLIVISFFPSPLAFCEKAVERVNSEKTFWISQDSRCVCLSVGFWGPVWCMNTCVIQIARVRQNIQIYAIPAAFNRQADNWISHLHFAFIHKQQANLPSPSPT